MATGIPNQPLIQELTPNDLPHVLEELSPLSPRNVVNFGLVLNVKKEVIEGFELQYNHIMRDVLREIVNQRLKQEPALTWREIVSALRSPLIKEEQLARKIECQYIPSTKHKRSDTLDSTNAQLRIPRASPASLQVSGVASLTNQHPGYYEGLPPPTLPQHSIHQPPYQSQSSNIYVYQQLPPQQSVVQHVSQPITGQKKLFDVSVVCGPTISSSRPPLPSTANPTSAPLQTSGEPVPPRPHYNFPLSPTFHQSIPQHPNQSPLHSTVAYHQPPPPNPLYQHPTQYAPHLPTHPPPCQHIPPTYPYYTPPYPPVHYGPPPQVASSVASTHDVPETGAPAAKRPREQSPVRPHPQPHSLPSQHMSTSQSKPDRSPLVSQYIDYVRTVYKSSEVEQDACSLKWPPTPSKVYINLVCIDRTKVRQRNEYDEVTKAMVQRGDIDVVHGKKWPIDFNEIATCVPDKGQKRVVLVEGAPGVGKSTFAWEYCRRWERGEIAQQYQLVLLLRLRDERMSKAKTLRDLITYDSEDVRQAVSDDLERSHGSKTLILLEGFDELPDTCRTPQSVFVRLICGELLPLATVMVTSRPWATGMFLKHYQHRLLQRIEILGFTNEQIPEYIESILPENKAEDLKSYMKTHPQIRGCMYIPLNCAIVVTVYQESQASGCPLPTTLTELYTALAQILLVRHLCGHPELGKGSQLIWIFKDLTVSCDVQRNFIELCKLAYNGIVGKSDQVQLIFKESDLPADFDNLGFMDSVTELYVTRGTVSSHNFLHLTFQEFFAAVHISTMSPAEQLQHFQGCEDGRLMEVLRFLAGITKLSCLSGEGVQHSLLATPRQKPSKYSLNCDIAVDREVVNWMFEAQSDDVIALLNLKAYTFKFEVPETQLLTVEFVLDVSMLPMDYYSLGYCVAHSQCQWVLDNAVANIIEVKMLVAGASLKSQTSGRVVGIRGAYGEYPDIDIVTSTIFNRFKNILHLHELSLTLSEQSSDIKWPDLSSLRVLKLSITNKLAFETLFLLPSLTLESLTVDASLCFADDSPPSQPSCDSPPSCEYYVPIARHIRTATILKELSLNVINLNEEGMEVIAGALASSPLSLERLVLVGEYPFTDTAADCLAQFVTNSTTLQCLYLSLCQFRVEGLQALAQSLCHKIAPATLKELSFSYMNMNEKEIEVITRALASSPLSLERLVLEGECSFTDTAADCLAQFITRSTTLQCLGLNVCQFRFGGLQALAKALHHTSAEKEVGWLDVILDDEQSKDDMEKVLCAYPDMRKRVRFE